MERRLTFTAGEYYHVFNRGAEKMPIFRDQNDWKRLRDLLYLGNSSKSLVLKLIQGDPLEWDRGETIVDILAYSLMNNHFHIIAHEKTDGGITKFMGKISTAYSMYFNTKYERSGPLLCRPFRAKHIDSDEYFRWLFSYVHLNPIGLNGANILGKENINIADAKSRLVSHTYNSYPDYFEEPRAADRILNKEKIPVEIADLEDLSQMLEEVSVLQGDPLE